MKKYEAEFSNLIRSYLKKFIGKGPSKITSTIKKNMVICDMEGNLSPVEKFFASTEDGKQMLREARTEMVKQLYKKHPPQEMEELLEAKFLNLFIDISIEKDHAMSVFIFNENIEEKLKGK